MNHPRQFFGGGGGVHGEVCWLIVYMYSNINYSIKLLSASNISDDQVTIVNNLGALLSVKSGSHDIIGFNFNEANDLIHNILSTM